MSSSKTNIVVWLCEKHYEQIKDALDTFEDCDDCGDGVKMLFNVVSDHPDVQAVSILTELINDPQVEWNWRQVDSLGNYLKSKAQEMKEYYDRIEGQPLTFHSDEPPRF